MTKQEILERFKDINEAYKNCCAYDDLSAMLDELIETIEKKPKDVIVVLDKDNFPHHYECPKCRNKIVCSKQLDRCEKCRQALNWANIGRY